MYYLSALKANAKKAYTRITQSRITTTFFLFSFLYCVVQSIIQSLLYSVDIKYSTLVSDIVKGGNIPPTNFTFLEGQRGHLHLQICDDIPSGQIPYPCTTVYRSSGHLTRPLQIGRNRQPFVLDDWEGGINVTTVFSPLNATNVVGVQIETLHSPVKSLDEQCVQILLHSSQILQKFKQEDTTVLCLQFWLLVISFIAILHDSVPHTLAALMTHALETGWTGYAALRGPFFRDNFQELLADPGSPCSLDLFSAYWRRREVYEAIDLMMSSTGLIVFSYLSWTLLKVYNAQSMKCVGAPQHVTRIHKFFRAVLVCLQLEVFFLVTSVGLWSGVFTTSAVAYIYSHSAQTRIYKILYIGTILLLLPWITMGWYAIRREMRKMMIVFLGMAFVLTCCSSIMFYSVVYRWSFVQWPYLACYTVASFLILIATTILGIICRMNFGKGLAQYLHAEETLASLNFAPDSFSHDTRVNVSLWKELDMKVPHLGFEDKCYQLEPTSPRVYYIQSLVPKDGSDGDSEYQQHQFQLPPLSRPSHHK